MQGSPRNCFLSPISWNCRRMHAPLRGRILSGRRIRCRDRAHGAHRKPEMPRIFLSLRSVRPRKKRRRTLLMGQESKILSLARNQRRNLQNKRSIPQRSRALGRRCPRKSRQRSKTCASGTGRFGPTNRPTWLQVDHTSAEGSNTSIRLDQTADGMAVRWGSVDRYLTGLGRPSEDDTESTADTSRRAGTRRTVRCRSASCSCCGSDGGRGTYGID